jgi:hypothetical protein
MAEPKEPVCPGCKHYDEVSEATTLGKGRCHNWRNTENPKIKDKFQYWPTGYDGTLVFKCASKEV